MSVQQHMRKADDYLQNSASCDGGMEDSMQNGSVQQKSEQSKPQGARNEKVLEALQRANQVRRENSALKKENLVRLPQKPLPMKKKTIAKSVAPVTPGNKRGWDNGNKIVALHEISKIPDTMRSKKKYKIVFKYADKYGQIHSATVRFGLRNKLDRVDGIPEEQAILRCAKIRKVGTPFDSNFWDITLLNNPEAASIQQAQMLFKQKQNIL